jgi:hypothetical protein
MSFREWLESIIVSGPNPKRKKGDTFNYWGSPGNTSGLGGSGKMIFGKKKKRKKKKCR